MNRPLAALTVVVVGANLLLLDRCPVKRLAGDEVDYVTVADPDELTPYPPETELGPRALIAIAAFVGSTRLIDNLVLGEDAPIS